MANLQIHELSARSGSALRSDLLAGVRGTAPAEKQTHDQTFATLKWKDPVRTVDTTALSPTTAYEAGDSVGGVTLAEGDRILRATPGGHADDGIYIASASGAASRAVDAPSGGTAELVGGSSVRCSGGYLRGTLWRLVTIGTITIGTTPQTWVMTSRMRPFGISTQSLWASGERLVLAPRGIGDSVATTLTADTAYIVPLIWPVADKGPTSVNINVTGAVASAQVVIAIYRALPDWTAGAQLLRDNTITAATTGAKAATFSELSVQLEDALFVGIYCDKAISVNRINTPELQMPLSHTSSLRSNANINKASETFAGVFPSTFSATGYAPANTSTAPGIGLGY